MDASNPTSLQRFVQGPGKAYVDLKSSNIAKSMRHAWLWIALMPAIILLVAFLPNGDQFTVRLIAVPAVIFAFSIVFSLYTTRRIRQTTQKILGERTTTITLANGVSVTPEAQDMVMALHWHYWTIHPRREQDEKAMREFKNRQVARAAQQTLTLWEAARAQSRRVMDGMPSSAMDLLEQAAFQYNRTVGLVETLGAGETGPSVTKGADEAMVVVLHRARQIAKYPENLTVLEPVLTASADTLRELADSVEALTTHGGFTPTAGIEHLLDELRLKLAALNELSPTSTENLHGRS